MEVASYFTDFLTNIRTTEDQRKDFQTGHKLLRERLTAFEPLKPAIVTTFLQGSYKRSTAVRPAPNKRSDVDIIVVTRLHENEYTPSQALELFRPFIREYYKNEYRYQGRSIGISQGHVDLDLVITSAPPESVMGVLPEEGRSDAPLEEETLEHQNKRLTRSTSTAWKDVPLRIPDREAMCWEDTHPLAQLEWTRERNARTNGHFVNVVKAIKWWRYDRHPKLDQPKSYPLERIVADSCPDRICSVAEGVTKTLDGIVSRYAAGKPMLRDHGCHPDVLHRITREQFHEFYQCAVEAAKLARAALDADGVQESATRWRGLFGDKFPSPPPSDDDTGPKGGFSPRTGPSRPGTGRFA
jgi:predicted nucleotidyltransferase